MDWWTETRLLPIVETGLVGHQSRNCLCRIGRLPARGAVAGRIRPREVGSQDWLLPAAGIPARLANPITDSLTARGAFSWAGCKTGLVFVLPKPASQPDRAAHVWAFVGRWLGRGGRRALARVSRREQLQLDHDAAARQTSRTVPGHESRQAGRDYELAARTPHTRTAGFGHRRGELRLTADPRDLSSNGVVPRRHDPWSRAQAARGQSPAGRCRSSTGSRSSR